MRYREIREAEAAYDIQAKYDSFNAKYFGGELPKIPLSFADMKRASGVVRFTSNRTTHALVPGTMRLILSNRFKWSEEQFDSTLIHEMIHVYFINRGFTREGHGIRFKSMMNKLRRETGINITLKDTVDDVELASDTLKTTGVILLKRQNNEGYSFTLISPKMAHTSHEDIVATWHRRTGFETVGVYTVSTPTWTSIAGSYPISRKLDGGLYRLKDLNAVKDLVEHGHLLSEVRK